MHTHSLTHALTYSFFHSISYMYTHSLTHMHSLTHTLTQSDAHTHSSIHSLSYMHTHSPTDMRTHSLTHILTHSLTRSFSHSLYHPLAPPLHSDCRIIRGGNGLCDGPLKDLNPDAVLKRVESERFGHVQQAVVKVGPVDTISRLSYALTYGPTVGDKVSFTAHRPIT